MSLPNDTVVESLLAACGAYTDLEEPVILTSGWIGIYYVNTEKIAGDGGEFVRFGDASDMMIEHALSMVAKNPDYSRVISSLVDAISPVADRYDDFLISGGQYIEWLFSGPVAYFLERPHLSLYKNGRGELIMDNGRIEPDPKLAGMPVIHISDLMTRGSSSYDNSQKPPTGWIPAIRRMGGRVGHMCYVVSRMEGGDERIRRAGVEPHYLVGIDEDFLRRHSKDPERALEYAKDPDEWGKKYLREHGVAALIETFDPSKKEFDRVKRFLNIYRDVLVESGRWKELETMVEERYMPLSELFPKR